MLQPGHPLHPLDFKWEHRREGFIPRGLAVHCYFNNHINFISKNNIAILTHKFQSKKDNKFYIVKVIDHLSSEPEQ